MPADRHDPRTDDGARDTVALLEALIASDIDGAQAIIDHCDPQPTILGLASAWITVVDYHGLDPAALLDSMRRNLT